MTKIYISGSITHDPNYKEKFEKAERKLIERGYEVLNPIRVAENFKNLTHKQYMKIDLVILECADAIYMLKDWKSSKGAVIEQVQALQDGKEVIYEEREVLSDKYKWHYNYKEE